MHFVYLEKSYTCTSRAKQLRLKPCSMGDPEVRAHMLAAAALPDTACMLDHTPLTPYADSKVPQQLCLA